jgi:putative ABC transport system substrate-binding protein
MKKKTRWLFLFVPLVLLFVGSVPTWSAGRNVDIAMVLWRGVTEAEKGFLARMEAEKKYNVDFTVFDANQDKKKLSKIIGSLNPDKYELIYSFGTTVTKTLKKTVSHKPIVFNIVARPVKAKVIESWERSGCNVTGASNAVPMSSAFNSLSKVLYIGRLGFIYNPKEANSMIQRDEVEKLQKEFGYEMVDTPIESVDRIDDALAKVVDAKVDAVLLPSDSFVKAYADKIIPPLNRKKIPTIVSIPAMVRDNHAFLGLGPNYFELGKLAAEKALAILAGAKPNDIPSSTLERLHMTVNLTTAKEIGVNVPVQILRLSTVVR